MACTSFLPAGWIYATNTSPNCFRCASTASCKLVPSNPRSASSFQKRGVANLFGSASRYAWIGLSRPRRRSMIRRSITVMRSSISSFSSILEKTAPSTGCVAAPAADIASRAGTEATTASGEPLASPIELRRPAKKPLLALVDVAFKSCVSPVSASRLMNSPNPRTPSSPLAVDPGSSGSTSILENDAPLCTKNSITARARSKGTPA
mmetsp:Transcript_4794/g.16003  ORF Transcript_4794/g.16003 Transcript_4794/m.16003 type:complete len:207 (+) Transcript_4794:1944-2564(+)